MTGSTKATALSKDTNYSRKSGGSKLKAPFQVVALLLMFLSLASGSTSPSAQPSLLNKPAPAFVRTDLQGRRIDLTALRGKVVLLNFWASWCGPCQVELPQFQAWQRKYESAGFQVIAISMDDEAAPVRSIVRKLHLEVPVVMGDETLGREYGGVLGLPVTFLIARDGRILERREGAADLPAMERKIRNMLAAH